VFTAYTGLLGTVTDCIVDDNFWWFAQTVSAFSYECNECRVLIRVFGKIQDTILYFVDLFKYFFKVCTQTDKTCRNEMPIALLQPLKLAPHRTAAHGTYKSCLCRHSITNGLTCLFMTLPDFTV